jgi:hypothetical protein
MACGCLMPNIRFSRTTSIMLLVPLLGAVVGMFSYAIIEKSVSIRAVARVYNPIEKQFAEHLYWKCLLDAAWMTRPLPYQKAYPRLYITDFIWLWAIIGGMLVGIPLGIAILSTQRRRAIFVGIAIVGAVAGEMVLWNAIVTEFSEWERYRTESLLRCLS